MDHHITATAVLLLLPLAAPGVAADHQARHEEEPYIGGITWTSTAPMDCYPPVDPPNLGGVCFRVHDGETTVDLSIQEDENVVDSQPIKLVAAYYVFLDGGSEPSDRHGFFCGSISDLPIPPDHNRLAVQLLDPSIASLVCLAPAAATTGTISATFFTH